MVWGKKIFGKEYMGIIRTTIIIKANKKVHKVWHNVQSKIMLMKFFRKLKIFNFTNEKR